MHKRHLAEAERHIARSLVLIAKQRNLIERLKRDGLYTCQARHILSLFEETLKQMHAHRELILRALR